MAGVGVVLGQPHGPRSVEQITRAAQDYEYDAAVPLKYWLRTAGTLLREAEIYSREGDEETTYFLLFRHAHLILAQLAQHPQAKERDKPSRIQLKQAEQAVNKNLKVLDLLKPKINERYDRYNQIVKEREARRNAQSRRSLHGEKDGRPEGHYDVLQQKTQRLQAHEHKDLAVKIAQRESSRRAAVRQDAPQRLNQDGDDLSQRLQAIRARVEPQEQPTPGASDSRPRPQPDNSSTYRYPIVPAKQVQYQAGSSIAQPERLEQSPPVGSPPAIPPKLEHASAGGPARPEKIPDQPSRPRTPEGSYTFVPSAHLENGAPLRSLFIPPTLRTTFLRLAHKNTLANLETCGFLAGTLSANAFFVSKLIVPAQTSTSDTCEMTNESQLFDYVDSEDLMILGWIHTHPSQTCFMSSRDLHTHAGYQMMLAESVAIVCAPSKGDTTHGGDWGVFRLTDPPGKKAILSCEKPGLFHPHEVDNIYTDAQRPGHVVEVPDLLFEVVDLR